MTDPVQLNRAAPLAAAAFVALAAACATPALTGPTAPAPRLAASLPTCEIHVISRAGTTVFEARAQDPTARPVRHAFTIRQSGAGGAALIVQGGETRLDPTAATVLGEARLGGAAALYDAELTLTGADGQVLCSARRSGARL